MDFLNSLKSAATSAVTATATDTSSESTKPHPADSPELLSDAKVVAEAAQFTFTHQTDKIDKAGVAGAAADILHAAGEYGKLDESKGVGQYLDKAEDYLNKYESSNSKVKDDGKEGTESAPAPVKKEEDAKDEPPVSSGDGDKKEAGGIDYGDVMKVAGSFFNK